MKKFIRNIIRYFFRIRESETFSDGLSRHYYHLRKKLPHKKVSAQVFEKALVDVGIKAGDVLIVHSSWRALYMLDVKPEEIISIMIGILGESGTLLMPAYGHDSDGMFDLNNTISAAGVLSETLRNIQGVRRSSFPKFSMVAYGKNADDITKTHIRSEYQFDELSPYSIAIKQYNAKVLLLGLGLNPHKISVFHCASYDAKDNNTILQKCYSYQKYAVLINGTERTEIKYFDRDSKYQNNKIIFKKLFERVPKHIYNRDGFNAILFDGKDAYEIAYEYCSKGGTLYKS